MNDIIIITQIFNMHKMSRIRLNANYKTQTMNLRHGYNICSYNTIIRVPSRMRKYAYIDLQYKEFEFLGMTVVMNICEKWD